MTYLYNDGTLPIFQSTLIHTPTYLPPPPNEVHYVTIKHIRIDFLIISDDFLGNKKKLRMYFGALGIKSILLWGS